MATVHGEEVTLKIETQPEPCSKCAKKTRVLIVPELICANCWSHELLNKHLQKLAELANQVKICDAES